MKHEKLFLDYLKRNAGTDAITQKSRKQAMQGRQGLDMRKNNFNKKFDITPSHIEKLQKLNDLCIYEEQRIYCKSSNQSELL